MNAYTGIYAVYKDHLRITTVGLLQIIFTLQNEKLASQRDKIWTFNEPFGLVIYFRCKNVIKIR